MATLLESYKGKTTGSTLTATEWNNCLTTIETGITQASLTGSSSGSSASSNFTSTEETVLKNFADNNIEYSGSDSNNLVIKSAKHVNVESASGADIQLKPGDDISFMSHHRVAGKLDKVSTKIVQHSKVPSIGTGDNATTAETKEMDHPVEWEVNAANLTFTTVDKDDRKVYDTLMYDSAGDTVPNTSSGNQVDDESNDEIFNVKINTGKSGVSDNKKGYLKVRARAIDLRCEEHGGIALQPYGSDSEGSENKIKFEHGGGDGLEFGTFNTQKTSIFTDEYRFNKDGIWKMATRTKETSDKYATGEETTHYKYKKNTKGATTEGYETGDDFYDFIDTTDEQCTTNALIKTGNALNGGKNRHAKVTSSGNVEIQTNITYHFAEIEGTPDELTDLPTWVTDLTAVYNSGDLTDAPTVNLVFKKDGKLYQWQAIDSPKIKIISGDAIDIESKEDATIKSESEDVILDAGDVVKLQGKEIRLSPEDYADDDTNEETNIGFVNFGTTPKVVFLATKITSKGKIEAQDLYVSSTVYNNTEGTIYYNSSTNKVIIPQLTVLYTEVDTLYYPTATSAKTTVYTDSACTTKPSADLDGAFVADASGNVYYVEFNSDLQAKKEPKLLTGTTGYDNVTFCLPSDHTVAEENEEEIASKGTSTSGISCNIGDLITLVNWFKNNSLGPWNADTVSGGIKNA